MYDTDFTPNRSDIPVDKEKVSQMVFLMLTTHHFQDQEIVELIILELCYPVAATRHKWLFKF